mmetsp:Transcript_123488/g.357059  ORF Transcript_123488/g.357059 Transcript_123488/m.357059 type:complete len:261 (+) Transcript_123488:68-850(+)
MTMYRIIAFSLLLCSGVSNGFFLPQTTTSSPLVLHAKGFGTKDTPSPKKKQQIESPPPVKESSEPFPKREESDMSQGKAALEKMRRERAEKRNEELKKVKEVQEVDAMLRESPEAAVIPEKVAQRMGMRMLPFVGIPLFGAMGSFVGFWYMATYRDMEFQPALVAATSIALLATGLIGITYSIMSASWDPDREGSFLGTEEFSKNVDNIKTGLSRSRENARLRDRMDEFSPAELSNMEQKQAAKEKRQQSFGDKFGDEFD